MARARLISVGRPLPDFGLLRALTASMITERFHRSVLEHNKPFSRGNILSKYCCNADPHVSPYHVKHAVAMHFCCMHKTRLRSQDATAIASTLHLLKAVRRRLYSSLGSVAYRFRQQQLDDASLPKLVHILHNVLNSCEKMCAYVLHTDLFVSILGEVEPPVG